MLKLVETVSRAIAILGGLVLSVLVFLVCVSVAGRGVNTFAHWSWLEQVSPELGVYLAGTGIGPLPGDFEVVEAGIAFAIFSFLPLCQLYAGHATVDIFTSHLSKRINLWLVAFWEVCLTSLILLITWRLFLGTLDKFENGETTFILRFPVWWAFALSVFAASIASLVAIYCAFGRVTEAATGRKLTPTGVGAIH